MVLPGDQITEVGEDGARIVGDSFAILFNAYHEPISFHLGARQRDVHWKCVLDTAEADAPQRSFKHMSEYALQARSLTVFRAEIHPFQPQNE